MHLAHLSLTNFRNYVRLELDLTSGVTVVQGDNAQGKTNLLEAMHILATTKSLRGVNDRELINWVALDEPIAGARLAGDLVGADGETRIEVGLTLQPSESADQPSIASRRYRVNGVPKRAADLLGHFIVVLFSPEDIELVAGAPAFRRRHLDIAISQIDRRYLRALQQYQRVLIQRNHLLKQIRDSRAARGQLEFWDLQLIEHGAYILGARMELIAALNEGISTIHSQLAGRSEHLQLTYQSSVWNDGAGEGASIEELRSLVGHRLQEGRDKECASGTSLYGPHRDDLRFAVDGVDVQTYGSRGQQRTVALAMKLAESDTIARVTGTRPVLLLDDVMSELDAHRRRQVLSSIHSDQQVIVTCTDFSAIDQAVLERATCLSIVDGRVFPAASSASVSSHTFPN